MIGMHIVPEHDFTRLATGGGGGETIAMLQAGQLSKRILLIQAVLDMVRRDGPPSAAAALVSAHGLLTEIQRQRPDAVADVLSEPGVGLWAATCLRRQASGSALRGEDDYGYLGGVAAAAALRAGHNFEIEVPVHNGAMSLPGMGTALLGAANHSSCVVRGRVSGALVTAGDQEIAVPADPCTIAPGWRGLHRMRVTAEGHDLTLMLDDIGRYRAPPGLPLARMLTGRQVQGWRQMLAEAWRLLVRHHPEHAEGLAAGLRVLVPLAARGRDDIDSATVPYSFGSIVLTRPGDGPRLALTLLHEFQHGKLAALQDLVPLHIDRTGRDYYAPWRDDPRPLGALLHGTYAHLAVTDFWRARRRYCYRRREEALAQVNFAFWRAATREAVDQLADSGEMTGPGERFIAGMTATVERWRGETVPSRALRRAEDYGMSNRLVWRMRHLHPDPSAIDRLAVAWLGRHSDRVGPVRVPATIRPCERAPLGSTPHLLALTAILRTAPPGTTLGRAELDCARGRYVQALAHYRAWLAADPRQPRAWAGLALALHQLAAGQPWPPSTGAAHLADWPELVYALYLRVCALDGRAPDPLTLAAWLAARGVTGYHGIGNKSDDGMLLSAPD